MQYHKGVRSLGSYPAALALLLAMGCGCASGSKSMTIAEYRPRNGPVVAHAPFSDVYQLYHWVPDRSKAGHQLPVEIWNLYAEQRSVVGFTEADGKVLAIAGSTKITIDHTHYTWQTLAGATQHIHDRDVPVVTDPPQSRPGSSPLAEFVDGMVDQVFESLFDPDQEHLTVEEDNPKGGRRGSKNHAVTNRDSPKAHPPGKITPPTSRPT